MWCWGVDGLVEGGYGWMLILGIFLFFWWFLRLFFNFLDFCDFLRLLFCWFVLIWFNILRILVMYGCFLGFLCVYRSVMFKIIVIFCCWRCSLFIRIGLSICFSDLLCCIVLCIYWGRVCFVLRDCGFWLEIILSIMILKLYMLFLIVYVCFVDFEN